MTTLKIHGIIPVKVCDPWYAGGLAPESHAKAVSQTNADLIRGLNTNHAEDKVIARTMRRQETARLKASGGAKGKSRVWLA